MDDHTTAEGQLDNIPMIDGMDPLDHPTSNLGSYRRYLEDRRCWVDGTPTHASSGQQRQCPKCRRKWSYDQRLLQISLLEQYCQGITASQAAKNIGCAKNTARSHYNDFRIAMEEVMAAMLTNGEVATNPVTFRELVSLEKALRAGSTHRREKACRHLFLCSLGYEERLQAIFLESIVWNVARIIEDATKPPEPPRTPEVKFSKPAAASAPRQQTEEPPFVPPQLRRKQPESESARDVVCDLWNQLRREVRGRWDPNCPYPSQACRSLGRTWTAIWEITRKMVREARRQP